MPFSLYTTRIGLFGLRLRPILVALATLMLLLAFPPVTAYPSAYGQNSAAAFTSDPIGAASLPDGLVGSVPVPVLMYHKVSPDPADGGLGLRVPVSTFQAQMEFLKARGYQSISLSRLFDFFEKGRALPKKPVVITFDDGYRDNYRYAFPVLRKLGFTATIFLVVDDIDGYNVFDLANGEPPVPMLSWTEVAEMDKAGFEFGAHTLTHPHLTKIPVAQALHEIAGSKLELERRLGHGVEFFAYPFGDMDADVEKLVKDAGFRGAASTIQGFANQRPDFWALKRVRVRGDFTITHLAAVLERPTTIVDLSAPPGAPNLISWLFSPARVINNKPWALYRQSGVVWHGLERPRRVEFGGPRLDAGGPRIALTFDDGPKPVFTEEILNVLKQHDAKATFFFTGKMAERFPELVQAVDRAGNEIGNHTYDHVNLTRLPSEALYTQLTNTKQIIRNLTGKPTRFFRPPGGDVTESIVAQAQNWGYQTAMWTINADDTRVEDPEVIVRWVVNRAKDGAVILMHNGSQAGLDALPRILEILQAQGYRFVTLSEILRP